MHVVIFEDDRWADLAPLSFSRPTCLLRCGAFTLLERIVRHARPTRLGLWCREPLAGLLIHDVAASLGVPVAVNTPLDDAPALLVSGRLALARPDEPLDLPHAAVDPAGDLAHAWVRDPGLSADDLLRRTARAQALESLPRRAVAGHHVRHAWDLLSAGEPVLAGDLEQQFADVPAVGARATLVVGDRDAIRIAPDAVCAPGVVLDATHGPVVIHARAHVGANAVVEGPCCIGPGSSILPLTLVRGGTVLGPVCKVGGEIGSTTLLAYSNKQHHGYIGDSYVGEWVNLGAGTVTGNLKNTLGEIRMLINRRTLPTGRQFLGAIIGDHARSATGTLLPAGCYVGYACHLSGPIRPPRFCRSGTMHSDDGIVPLDQDKARQIAAGVMARRSRQFEPWHDEAMRYAFAASRQAELPVE
jgi:UDP-N-acetylglucosamine diphosphorylase/glucosamine-1-phosphate N-acetyltransferase